jgi:hypothetical protein
MELSALIADALENEGFSVDRESFPMKARIGDEEYSIAIVKNQEEMEMLKHMEVSGKLLVISLEKDMEPFGDRFIDRDSLEKMVGSALISRLLGEKITKSDIISSFEDAFVENTEPVASVNPEIDVDSLSEDAFKTATELRPFYCYEFSVDDGENSEMGILLIDAVEGKVFRAKERMNPDMGEITIQRIEPAIGEDESMENAMDFLIKEHTREEEVVKEEGAVTVMEKKLIGIGKEDVHLKYLGMLYIPFLRIEGAEGIKAVDMSGITGRDLKE